MQIKHSRLLAAILTLTAGSWLPAESVQSQVSSPSASYGAAYSAPLAGSTGAFQTYHPTYYPAAPQGYSANPAGSFPGQTGAPIYTANREMLPTMPSQGIAPTDAIVYGAPPEIATARPEQKSGNSFTNFWKKTFGGKSKETPPKPSTEAPPFQGDVPNTAPDTANRSKTSDSDQGQDKKQSYFASILSPSSSNSKDGVDDGQDQIQQIEQERSFSEQDYLSSATKSKKTAAKDAYAQGMQQEAQGNFAAARRSYDNFIKANKKQTSNGTLAAPYHRLALISWKESEPDKADVYFRYGLRYAQGGNIAVIAGDYSLFLMDRGRLREAEVILRNTMLHFPKDQRLAVSLGRCVARQDKPVEALRYMTPALGEEQAYQELALMYHMDGKYDMARTMNQRRDVLIARRSEPIPSLGQGQYAARPVSPAGPLPTTPPPVMNNAPGMANRATLPAMPYPMLNDSLQPPVNDPVASTVPKQEIPHAAPKSPNWNAMPETVPENSTIPAAPAVPSMPVSKVYHYPADSMTPIYHQYTGDTYPQTVSAVVRQSETAPTDPNGGYYRMSTVPGSQPTAEASDVQPVRGGYPPSVEGMSSYWTTTPPSEIPSSSIPRQDFVPAAPVSSRPVPMPYY